MVIAFCGTVAESLTCLIAHYCMSVYSEVLYFSSFLAQLGVLNNCRLSVWLRCEIL